MEQSSLANCGKRDFLKLFKIAQPIVWFFAKDLGSEHPSIIQFRDGEYFPTEGKEYIVREKIILLVQHQFA